MSSAMTSAKRIARVKAGCILDAGEIGHPFDPLVSFVEMRQRDEA